MAGRLTTKPCKVLRNSQNKFNYGKHTTFYCFCRPIAGYINFCPLALESEQDDNQVLTVAMHELTHTLVRHASRWCIQFSLTLPYNLLIIIMLHVMHIVQTFSHLLIPFWRDSNGRPRTSRSSSTRLPPTDSNGYIINSCHTTIWYVISVMLQ